MAIALFILAAIAFVNGATFWFSAKSAIHQILGAITFLISAVLLSGGCIIVTINKHKPTQQTE